MTTEDMLVIVRRVADLIADARYEDAVRSCTLSRLSPTDLAAVIEDYGRTFVALPDDFGTCVDSVAIQTTAHPAWSVRAPLWTVEEGRSDLTLEMTIEDRPGQPRIELDDLKVM